MTWSFMILLYLSKIKLNITVIVTHILNTEKQMVQTYKECDKQTSSLSSNTGEILLGQVNTSQFSSMSSAGNMYTSIR